MSLSFIGSASSRGKQTRSKKAPKEIVQLITPSQMVLLEKMQSEQKQREAVQGDIEVEEGVDSIVGSIIKSVDIGEKGEKLPGKDLTFVSSLTFAEMILKINDENKMDQRVEGTNIAIVNRDDIKNDAAVPLFYNPLTLVVKGNVHNAELSLLRREGTYDLN